MATTEKILFVDDEPNILQSISRQLRNRFPLQTAGSGDEALRILEKEGPFSVIVSDMRMPGMNGVELLSVVKDKYPDTVRLMLTGNADQQTATAAVNSGQIFRFLTKPCSPATFITALALAQRQYRLITAERELLQKTLMGSISVLSELLAVANPLAFSAGLRCRDYVVAISTTLDLPHLWQYEIAALMSQIGCVTLPGEILHKHYADLPLSLEEMEMYQQHPASGASLLEKIPRLENVTKMIALQLKDFDQYTEEVTVNEFPEVLTGAQILKATLDFDRCLYRGMTRQAAASVMVKNRRMYNPKVLNILTHLKVALHHHQVVSLPARQISIGMIAVEDIFAKNGVLIIAKGQEITAALVQGLTNFSRQVGVVEPLKVRLSQATDELQEESRQN